MQEKTTPSMVVATLNRIEGLPPELYRKGRFDEVFYVGLPDDSEREEILNIHVKKLNRDPKNVFKSQISTLVKMSENFSGAELAESVNAAMFTAFDLETELDELHIQKAIQDTRPMSQTNGAQLKEMSQWAENNAVNASREPKRKGKSRAKAKSRDVEL
jgi:SpoVK/Ycf46/Vps4 family AAA+-type ATPase